MEIFKTKKVYLSVCIELKLPKAFGSINTHSVDNRSSILLELNGREMDENSIFTILDLPINRFKSLCRRLKVSNQNSSNSNNHAYETSYPI